MLSPRERFDTGHEVIIQYFKREIDRLTRPLVPSNADPNLEEEYSSEDEEEVDGRVDCPLDPLDKHLSYVDDFNLEQTDIEDEDEDEEEE